MIEVVVAERCTQCNRCVAVCPGNVFDPGLQGPPVIARPEDCSTCFMCELYCRWDALYVAPDCHRPVPVTAAHIKASGLLGQFRRDSGWDEWSGDPRYANEHWRMDDVFARARELSAATGLRNK